MYNTLLRWCKKNKEDMTEITVYPFIIIGITILIGSVILHLVASNSPPVEETKLLLGYLVVFGFLVFIPCLCLAYGNSTKAKLIVYLSGLFGGFAGIFIYYSFFVWYLEWWMYIIILIAIAELGFLLDKEKKPKTEKPLSFTIEKKLDYFGISLFLLLVCQGSVTFMFHMIKLLQLNIQKLIEWFGIIGFWAFVVILIIAFIYFYLMLNAKKYGRGR